MNEKKDGEMFDLFIHSVDYFEMEMGRGICERWPNYRLFWNEFVGQRSEEGMLKRYKYENEIKHPDIGSEVSKICQYRYAIFRDLACARVSELHATTAWERALQPTEYILFVKNLEDGFIRLGNALDKFKTVWNILIGLMVRSGRLVKISGEKFKIRPFLEQKSPDLKKALIDLEEKVEGIRHYLTHTSSLPSKTTTRGFMIPRQVEVGEKWEQYHGGGSGEGWIDAIDALRENILGTQNLVNRVDEIFIIEFRECMAFFKMKPIYGDAEKQLFYKLRAISCVKAISSSTQLSSDNANPLLGQWYEFPKGSGDQMSNE